MGPARGWRGHGRVGHPQPGELVTVEVIDVSGNQSSVDYDRVKASGVEAVIVKATEGVNYIDPMFHTHVMRAIQAGLTVMAYHYLRIRHGVPQDAHEQARQFCKLVQDCGLPPLVFGDYEGKFNEDARPQEWAEAIRGFIVECSTQMGRPPCSYTDPGEWTSYGGVILATAVDIGATDLWLADPRALPIVPSPWTEWKLLQYSGTGLPCSGVMGVVDRSRFAGTLDEFRAWVVPCLSG